MGEKVTFDPLTRIITIDEAPDGNGEVFIDVKVDLYSDGKEDWVATENLRRLNFPIEAVGGQDLPGSKSLGTTFFLASDWKIRPYEASHTLRVNGNLYSVDGTDPILATVGAFAVRIIQFVSNLVDSIVQQLPEIQFGSFGNRVTMDAINGVAGTDYPIGNLENPSNNWTDTLVIAVSRGFHDVHVHGDYEFGATDVLDDMIIEGDGRMVSTLTLTSGVTTVGTKFRQASVVGVLNGAVCIEVCRLGEVVDLEGLEGCLDFCQLGGTIRLAGEATFANCVSDVPGMSTPVIDFVGAGTSFSMRAYSGGIELQNAADITNKCTVEFIAGQAILNANCNNNATVSLRGIFNLTNNSTTLVPDLLSQAAKEITLDSIPSQVWDTLFASHVDDTTMGWILSKVVRAIGLGRMKQADGKAYVYDPDLPEDEGAILATFDTLGQGGSPADVKIYDRKPV